MPDVTVSADVDSMLRSANDAAIRSAIGVGTTDAPTFLAQTLTGQSLTGTQATSLVDLNATWNTTGTPTALKLNVTDTASNAASNLMDLQVGGVSKLKINKAGDLVNPTWSLGALAGGHYGLMGSVNGAFLFLSSANQRGVWVTNSPEGFVTQIYNSLLKIGGLGTDFTTLLTSDANGILAQRNGTAKQALRVYNTALAGAPEWGEFDWITSGGTNTLRIGTNLSGTGAVRGIDFVIGGSRKGGFAINGYFDTSAISVGFISWTGGTGGARIYKGGTDGTFGFYNGAESVGTLLNIATAGYMKVRNIGDTAFNNIQGKLTTDTAYTATVVTPTGFLTLYDSTGTAYRVPCVV